MQQSMNDLTVVFNSQVTLQRVLENDLENFDEKQRASFIKENMLWVIDELSEALHELPYAKSWSNKYDKPSYDKEKQMELFKEEMIDSFTFMLNIFLAAGMTAEELVERYMEKNSINLSRQVDPNLGYI